MAALKTKLVDNTKVRLTLVKENGDLSARSIPWLMIENEIRDCYRRQVPASVEYNGQFLGFCRHCDERGWLWWVRPKDFLRAVIEDGYKQTT